MTESKLQQLCFLWHWNTHHHERGRLWMQYNNPKNAEHGAILKGMGMVAGVSDLAYLREDGRMVFIELKVGTGQSAAQKWWQGIVTAHGAEYHLIHTLEEFQTLITSLQCAMSTSAAPVTA